MTARYVFKMVIEFSGDPPTEKDFSYWSDKWLNEVIAAADPSYAEADWTSEPGKIGSNLEIGESVDTPAGKGYIILIEDRLAHVEIEDPADPHDSSLYVFHVSELQRL